MSYTEPIVREFKGSPIEKSVLSKQECVLDSVPV